MMDDILKQINAGEVSGVQFKERILDKYDIACELVAFSNSHGGKLVVHDKSNQVEDLDTGLRYSNTDLDTGLRYSNTDLDTGLRYSNTDLDTGLRYSNTDLDTGLRHSDTDHDTFAEDHDTRLRHSDTNLDTSDTDLDTQLRHSDTPKVSLSNKQRDIVNFCSVPRTTKEILDRIGVSMHSKNRERYITSLVAAGYLQMTNPDNPTASNQKYKKVNKR